MKNLKQQITKIAENAKAASRKLAVIPREVKDKALLSMADALIANKGVILKANQKDIVAAKKIKLAPAMIDRLALDDKRISAMADSLRLLAALKDPVREILDSWQAPKGFTIRKVSVPIGVIAIIYESRPNVTSDCIGLCLKSGNCVILRGGKEALNSNIAIFKILQRAIYGCGMPKGSINLITTTERKAVSALLQLNNLIDLAMPRGGRG